MKKIKINNGFWPSLEEADYKIMKSFDKVFGLSVSFLFEDGVVIEYSEDTWTEYQHSRGDIIMLRSSNKDMKLVTTILLLGNSIEVSLNNSVPWIIDGIFENFEVLDIKRVQE